MLKRGNTQNLTQQNFMPAKPAADKDGSRSTGIGRGNFSAAGSKSGFVNANPAQMNQTMFNKENTEDVGAGATTFAEQNKRKSRCPGSSCNYLLPLGFGPNIQIFRASNEDS